MVNKHLIVKNIFDFLLALVLLIVFLPIMIISSILVMVFIGRPVIYQQIRPGLNCKPFKMYKFRSMSHETDDNGILLPDNERINLFGRFLRASSIDELPTIYNVLIGDMSFVGPRPLLMEYLSRYTEEQSRRNDVKPGITGLAQVNGRNSISWEKKFKFDVLYVDNQNFLLDLKILFLTLIKVLKAEGVSQNKTHTMEEFKGLKK